MGDNNVVVFAATAEAAVSPGHIDRPGAVNFGRGQWPLAQAPGDGMVMERGDGGNGTPARAAIGGVEGTQGGFVGVIIRDDDGAVGANDRLAANDSTAIGCGSAPGQSAIAGGAHLDQVATAVIVPLGVAVAVEGAAGGV